MGYSGKLTRLPFLTSEELHRRLHDELPQAEIRAWANGDAEVRRVLQAYFGGRAVTAQNLSDYKAGAKYQEWKKKREALTAVQEKTRFAVSLAQEAGLDLSDAGEAIMTSRLIEALEDESDPDQLAALTTVFSRLRAGSVARGSLAIRQKELEGRSRKMDLAERQFQMNTVKQFLKWAGTKEAQGILHSGKPKTIQMDLLHDLMFGKKPEPI